VVAMVASAGGVEALSTVVAGLPAGLRAAVLIAQHVSPRGPSALAGILDARSALPVRTAADGDGLLPGTVSVTPAGRHLLVTSGYRIVLVDTDEPPPSRPSADLLLASLAAVAGDRVVAVVLTGYGHDGQSGVRAVHRCGGYVIAQDEASSQQFSMPGAAIATGVVDEVVALDRLAGAIGRAVDSVGP